MARVFAAAVSLAFISACGGAPSHFSGTVQTEHVSVGSQIGGRVVATYVSAGQSVHRGQIVVRLDPAMLQAQYDQAVAQERAASAALRLLQSGTLPSQIAQAQGSSTASSAALSQTLAGAPLRIDAARAALADALANQDNAEREYTRIDALERTGDISRESLDNARATRDRARASVRQARAQLDQLLQSNLPGETATARANKAAAKQSYEALISGTKPEQIAQTQAQLRSAEAAAEHALAQLREASVYSPADGVVASFDLHPGDILGANQTAAIIDTFAQPYVYIYASQRDLERIRGARSMTVRSDSGSGTFNGRVVAFDRTAQFTPQNVETADQRAELVYGVKVRIDDPHHQLLDGTTVTVEPQ